MQLLDVIGHYGCIDCTYRDSQCSTFKFSLLISCPCLQRDFIISKIFHNFDRVSQYC